MLQAITCASPPALRMPLATSSQASALREEITTLAPSFASSSAEERPMPRLEPVTTATCPVRSKGVDFMVWSSALPEASRASLNTSFCAEGADPESILRVGGYGFRGRIFDAPRNDADNIWAYTNPPPAVTRRR